MVHAYIVPDGVTFTLGMLTVNRITGPTLKIDPKKRCPVNRSRTRGGGRVRLLWPTGD